MNDFKKIPLREFPIESKKNEDSKYWSLLKTPVIVKEFASVTCTNYSLAQPYDFAIASSTRVQVYSYGTQTVKRTISRFKDTVSSCAFRADGKLLVAGDNGGLIQLFDVNSRAVLRTFEGHKGAIRTIKYKYDKNQIISGSDDNTLKIWDIYKSDTPIYDFDEHTDYVRACNQSTENPNYILSGSYDHLLKMYDLRERNTVLSLDHGMPIESCLFLKGGSLVVSAGGNKIKLWDILAGGQLVQTISHHQKTITSICLDGTGSFLFSASLDHQVKISSLHDYKLVHSIKYPAPILSMDVAPDNSQLAVGMTGGLLSIRKRVVKTADIVEETQPRGGTNKFFNRHGFGPSTDDIIIEPRKQQKLTKYEKLLLKFQYSDALDLVLQKPTNPTIVTSLLDELVYRNTLPQALSNRTEETLQPLLIFINAFISNPKFSKLLIKVLDIILDLYAGVFAKSQIMIEVLKKSKHKVQQELHTQKQLLEIVGMLETLFTLTV